MGFFLFYFILFYMFLSANTCFKTNGVFHDYIAKQT